VICLVYLYHFAFFAFSSYSPKSLYFTHYIGLSLLDYAYLYTRMSSNEM
jgi:hypothetical protein